LMYFGIPVAISYTLLLIPSSQAPSNGISVPQTTIWTIRSSNNHPG
jgi:hypothetical protein